MSHNVAVYGTLKRGHSNHGVIIASGASFVMATTTTNKMIMYDGPYPKVVDRSAPYTGSRIHVEIWKVERFDRLDALEGHPNHFRRGVQSFTGMKELCWMYKYRLPINVEEERIVESGRWHRPEPPEFPNMPRARVGPPGMVIRRPAQLQFAQEFAQGIEDMRPIRDRPDQIWIDDEVNDE